MKQHAQGRRLGWWILLAVAFGALPLSCILDRSGIGSGQVGEGGAGGQGSTPKCELKNCPAPENPCQEAVCEKEQCAYVLLPAGSLCDDAGTMICSAVGKCVSALGYACRGNEDICTADTTCVDGVCCNDDCSGTCEACDLTDFKGYCTAIESGINAGVCEGNTVCDGGGDCTGGEKDWKLSTGDSGDQLFNDVAVDGDGNMYFVGKFTGTIDLKSNEMVTASGSLGLLVKYAANGDYAWHRKFEADNCVLYGVDVRDDGVYVVGSFEGDISGENIMSLTNPAMSNSIVVGKFTSAGVNSWLEAYEGGSTQEVTQIAADSMGNLFIAGMFDNEITFGGDTLTAVAMNIPSGYLAKLSAADGSAQWARRYGSQDPSRSLSLAVNKDGDVAISGETNGTMEIHESPVLHNGSRDCWAARFHGDGMLAWAKTFGSTEDEVCWAIRFDASGAGNVLAGHFHDSVNFGGGLLGNGNANDEGFILWVNANGAHTDSMRLGNDGSDEQIHHLRATSNGGWLIGGVYKETWSPGHTSAPLTSTVIGRESYVIRLSPGRRAIWARAIQGDQANAMNAFEIGPTNEAIFSVAHEGAFDWFGEMNSNAGGVDIFAARLTP